MSDESQVASQQAPDSATGSSRKKTDDKSPDKILLISYPKIVFLYPVFFF